MQNKPNFGNDEMNINTTVTMNYVILSYLVGRKNKPNSNPIKPITNPIKANTNPIQTQFYQSLSPRAAYLARNRGPIYHPYKGARPSTSLKDKNNDVIILRITMKNSLSKVSK